MALSLNVFAFHASLSPLEGPRLLCIKGGLQMADGACGFLGREFVEEELQAVDEHFHQLFVGGAVVYRKQPGGIAGLGQFLNELNDLAGPVFALKVLKFVTVAWGKDVHNQK